MFRGAQDRLLRVVINKNIQRLIMFKVKQKKNESRLKNGENMGSDKSVQGGIPYSKPLCKNTSIWDNLS